ncbi:uncharacterized protein C10orf120 homolog [Octodon degus]|uniref:Uncharacterized protein C10orf120 homolog n=1 Tax=Octodon degus TaxID=10160 RepID=A0A6P6DXV5_OCTDE|nr:uncharacterized protein C10orf120 homolog [Octodon degus]
MIRDWERGCPKAGTQRSGHPGTRERDTAEEKPTSNGKSVTVLSDSCYCLSQASRSSLEDLCPASPLRIWKTFNQSDPRIALGKYSPLEKEILRLGGAHTVATRRLLASKQEEERKKVRELRKPHPDYKQAIECKKQLSPPCVVCEPIRKIWTARVIVPAEEFKMPQREKTNISKHVERVRLAQALGKKKVSSCVERLKRVVFVEPTANGNGRKDGGRSDSNYCDKIKQEKKREKESKATRQEIKMNVIFKSEEAKKCLPCQPKDCKPFLPGRTQERFITGLTNRNLLPLADFPGDLMLMNQNFISRGIYPSDMLSTYPVQEGSACKSCMGKAAPSNY